MKRMGWKARLAEFDPSLAIDRSWPCRRQEETKMPKAGDKIELSDSQSITFVRTAAGTKGELLDLRVSYRPNSERPPAHYHPFQREHFEVLVGSFHARIDGQESIYQVGESFEVSPGAVHWMHNIASEKGELIWQIEPALRTEDLFAAMWTLERELSRVKSSPGLLQMAVLLSEFTDEFRLASPPFFIQRLLFGILAPLGRATGYRRAAEIAGADHVSEGKAVYDSDYSDHS
jgi:quercetin dioxygenase-like cupin family protein